MSQSLEQLSRELYDNAYRKQNVLLEKSPGDLFDNVKPFRPSGLELPKKFHSPHLMNPSRFGGGGVTGYWKEIGRTELGSSASSINVTSLAEHKYLMILSYTIATGGNTNNRYRFNSLSSGQYASRDSDDGGADGTFTSGDELNFGPSDSGEKMSVSYLSNISGEEKLQNMHSIFQIATGASQAPARQEAVAKIVPSPLTTAIDEVNVIESQPGSFAAGSQVIVLGWEDTLTHGIADNFWQFNKREELGSDGDVLKITGLTKHEWLKIRVFISSTGSTAARIRMGNGSIDTGNNYADRTSNDGAADGTTTSTNKISVGDPKPLSFFEFLIRNQSDKEKLIMGHQIRTTADGAATAPSRNKIVGKYTLTSGQVDQFQLDNFDTGDFEAGSFIEVWSNN